MKFTRRLFASIVLVVLIPIVCRADQLEIKPTTTLSAETANNTSAANSFLTQSNGNLGAGNISKLDIHSLLYPAAQTKIFAHLMLWFGQSDHMNIGYSSSDPAQVHRQITDMISRGFDGVVMVWYGPNNQIDRAAKLVMQEAESHPGFTFAIFVDNGAIRWDSCSGCNPQQAFTQDLLYVEQTYFPSPAYLRINGRPVVSNFDVDLYYAVDWNAAKAALSSDPIFLFQNAGGFTHALSGGAYSWDIPTTSDYGMSYLTKFYKTGLASPGQQTWGSAYKGFNDTQASWGLNRIMGQQCGQTWLQTFSKINSIYDSTNQLPTLQLVTWNDYEEGTEIESGIDNCVSIAANLNAGSLQWQVAGDENTVDHYTVYVSADGQNLMPLADIQHGQHTLDVCSYSLPSGNYSLFVQAVGKPNLSNQMSGAVKYQAQCGGSDTPGPPPVPPPPPSPAPQPAPMLSLSTSPSSVVIADGQSGSSGIMVTANSGSQNSISLSCSDLPVGMSCSFSPSMITPQSSASMLTISITRAGQGPMHHPPKRQPKRPLESYLFTFGVAGLVVLGDKKRLARALLLSAVIGWALLFSSCGAAPAVPAAQQSSVGVSPGAYTIAVNGSAGANQASTATLVTVR
ncbi:MAG TPA: hypothetical protein VHS34_09485 [Terriglobales bacterium]|nr:hypothetical protein [Terriglobales bacterium]